jgi:general secretion pathway protein G
MMTLCGFSPRRHAATARRGFSLAEILVAIVIIGLIAAIVVPTVFSRISQGESSAIAQTIDALRDGVLEYRSDVRRWPSHLRYLSAAPGSATDICGRTVPATFLAQWKGPYVNRSIGTTGLKLDDALVRDSIVRSPTTFTASTAGDLFIQVEDVDSGVARLVEREHDVTLDFAAGTIRWSNVANGRGILQLAIPVRGC